MPIDILMPAVRPGMTSGQLQRWLVAEGEVISPGRVIAEIASGGEVVEVTAEERGLVARILVPSSDAEVRVDEPIAILAVAGERSLTAASGDRKRASPAARRLAQERGIDLVAVAGSGPQGRILRRDILAARPGQANAGGVAALPVGHGKRDDGEARRRGFADWARPAAAAALSADERVLSHYPRGSYDLVPHDRLRRHVADRAREAQLSVPQQTVSVDIRADALLTARDHINAGKIPASAARPGARITLTDLIVKALGLALQQVPAANAAWTELGMLRHKSSDIGVAIALDGGVVTPVLRHVESKTLSEVSAELRAFRDRALRGRLTLEECRGGASTISNLGMLGVARCFGIVNPPQSSILAIGAVLDRPVFGPKGLEAVPMMACSLSADQRVIDGALAAELLGAMRRLIEDPVRMLA